MADPLAGRPCAGGADCPAVEGESPRESCPAATDQVLRWDPEVPGNCDTDATFDLSHLDYEDPEDGDPDWDVTVKIYNAAGSLVKTIVEEGGFVRSFSIGAGGGIRTRTGSKPKGF